MPGYVETPKPYPETDAWWVCTGCLAEWSAMVEHPEKCEYCGGKVVENCGQLVKVGE